MNVELQTYLDLLVVPPCLAELKNQIGARCLINQRSSCHNFHLNIYYFSLSFFSHIIFIL